MSDNNLSKNIFLQSKRASKLLDLPLSKSKDLIAKAIYQSHDWEDLNKKLKSNSLKSTVFPFAKIHPNSDKKLICFLENNIGNLLERFSKFLLTPVSPLPLLDLIWKIFGFSKRGNLSQCEPHIILNKWRQVADICDQHDTVIYSTCKINNVTYKVVLARAVSACSFANNTVNEVRELKEEFSKAKLAPLMWAGFDNWQHAVDVYFKSVDSSPDAFQAAFKPVFSQRNRIQKKFEDQFSACLEIVLDENLMSPLELIEANECMYYAIGYPINDSTEKVPAGELYLTDDHIINGKCVIGLADNILCIELIELNERFERVDTQDEYYSSLSDAMREFEDSIYSPIIIAGKHFEAYIRPCTAIEYDNYFRYPLFRSSEKHAVSG